MAKARKVRHALAMSIDREAINESILEGLRGASYLNQISINQDGWMAKWETPDSLCAGRRLWTERGSVRGAGRKLHLDKPVAVQYLY